MRLRPGATTVLRHVGDEKGTAGEDANRNGLWKEQHRNFDKKIKLWTDTHTHGENECKGGHVLCEMI